MEDKLKISVVTVCYNAADTIDKTIQSVVNQTYDNLEYIIIDGGSTDGTIDIIKKYADRIAYWVSEPDKGIYDAMNKGIAAATGDYINFMNAGDRFASKTVINEITKHICKADVLFGDVIICYKWGKIKKEGRYFNGKEWRLPFSHQSVFVKNSLIEQCGFDTSFRYAADHNMMYHLYLANANFVYVPIEISYYDAYGASNYNINSFKEIAKINHITGSEYFYAYYYRLIKFNIIKYMPKFLIEKVRQIKYKLIGCRFH